MTKDKMQIISAVIILVVALALIIFAPIFTILALNVVFAMGIPVNFWTWLSVLWLQSMIAARYNYKKD